MKRARKPDTRPADLNTDDGGAAFTYINFSGDRVINFERMDVIAEPKEARRLAAWLLRAAEWMERGR